MTAVTFTYLANAKIGFGLDMSVAIVIGLAAATIAIVAFFIKFKNGDAPALTEEDISID